MCLRVATGTGPPSAAVSRTHRQPSRPGTKSGRADIHATALKGGRDAVEQTDGVVGPEFEHRGVRGGVVQPMDGRRLTVRNLTAGIDPLLGDEPVRERECPFEQPDEVVAEDRDTRRPPEPRLDHERVHRHAGVGMDRR